MKRDMELIRLLLLDLEGEEVDLAEYSEEQIKHHKWLIWRSGLAEGGDVTGLSGPYEAVLTVLTPEGHDFLDAIRSDAVWNRVKQRLGVELTRLSFTLIQQRALEIGKDLLL